MKRNRERFPADFMFQLNPQEDHLRKLKFSPTLPFAFAEHGATMPASVERTLA